MNAPTRSSALPFLLMVVWLMVSSVFICACGGKKIEGVVVDPFGRPVDSVLVQVETTTFQSLTNKQGQYRIDYAPGKVTLLFSKPGFTTHEMTLDIQQKMKFPAESLMVYPKPSTPGMYSLSDTGLVALLTIPKGVNVTERRADWDAMNVNVVVRLSIVKPSADNAKLFLISDAREIQNKLPADSILRFVDMDSCKMQLMRVDPTFPLQHGFDASVQRYKRSLLSTRTEYDGLVQDSTLVVGREKIKIRQVRLAAGQYAWVETYFNQWAEKWTIKNEGKVYLFGVKAN